MKTVKGSELLEKFTRFAIINGITGIFEFVKANNGALVCFEELWIALEGKILVDEAELREIMSKVKPQRDINEYNVYHFCKVLLGEKQR